MYVRIIYIYNIITTRENYINIITTLINICGVVCFPRLDFLSWLKNSLAWSQKGIKTKSAQIYYYHRQLLILYIYSFLKEKELAEGSRSVKETHYGEMKKEKLKLKNDAKHCNASSDASSAQLVNVC